MLSRELKLSLKKTRMEPFNIGIKTIPMYMVNNKIGDALGGIPFNL